MDVDGDFFSKLARLTGRKDAKVGSVRVSGNGAIQMHVYTDFPPDLQKRLETYERKSWIGSGDDPKLEAEAKAFLNVLRKAFPKATIEMDEAVIYIYL